MSEGRSNLSEPIPSKEPVQFPTKATANAGGADSVNLGLAELASLARRAFEEKRRKNCLALTSAILKIDPNHKEALVIQSWVQSDVEQDLEKARKVFEEARLRKNPVGYDRAEVMLQSVLNVDPENEDAKALLHEIISSQPSIQPPLSAPRFDAVATVPEEAHLPPVPPLMPPVPLTSSVNVALGLKKMVLPAILVALIGAAIVAGVIGLGVERPADSSSDDLVAATGPGMLELTMDSGVQVFINDELKGTTPLSPLSLDPGEYRMKYQLDGQTIGEEVVIVSAGSVARNTVTSVMGRLNLIVVPGSGTRMSVDRGASQSVPAFLELKAGSHQLQFTADGYAPATLGINIKAGEDQYEVVTLQPASLPPTRTDNPPPARASNTPPPAAPQNSGGTTPELAPAVLEAGTVALSAAIPVEIYDGDTYLGSTPTTLKLTEGTHSLEFRYRQLRKSQPIVVRANQTTTATVTFETTVQINARPFAQVLIDGVQMRPLGETPLSNVRVPIGSVLVFRHPALGEKRVRVTGGETTIQVVFQ